MYFSVTICFSSRWRSDVKLTWRLLWLLRAEGEIGIPDNGIFLECSWSLCGFLCALLVAFNELVLSLLWSSISGQRGQDVGGESIPREQEPGDTAHYRMITA